MYKVEVARDADGRYYVLESDIIGLHAEADSLDDLREIIEDVAPDLIEANHKRAPFAAFFEPLFGRRSPLIKLSQSICVGA